MQVWRALGAPVRTLRFIAGHPLGSQALPRSVFDWFRWQLSSRLAFGPMLVPFVEDTSLVVETGMTGATGNVYCGLHDAEEMGFLLHFLRPTDSFVDVGANVGTFTILAAGVVGAQTHAFEPAPETFVKLMRNVRLNNLEHLVVPHSIALGAQRGEAFMTSGRDTTNHILGAADAVPPNRRVKVLIETLDDTLNGKGATLIKVDAEGQDLQVLTGARNVLANPATKSVIVEAFGPKHGNSILQLLQSQGYTPIQYSPTTREVELRRTLSAKNNTIFVKNIAETRTRVTEARKFRVKSLLV